MEIILYNFFNRRREEGSKLEKMQVQNRIMYHVNRLIEMKDKCFNWADNLLQRKLLVGSKGVRFDYVEGKLFVSMKRSQWTRLLHAIETNVKEIYGNADEDLMLKAYRVYKESGVTTWEEEDLTIALGQKVAFVLGKANSGDEIRQAEKYNVLGNDDSTGNDLVVPQVKVLGQYVPKEIAIRDIPQMTSVKDERLDRETKWKTNYPPDSYNGGDPS